MPALAEPTTASTAVEQLATAHRTSTWGFRAVVPAVDGVTLAEDGAPDAIEYAVEMRRFDEQRMLAASLAHDDVTSETVAEIGRAVARFHAGCPVIHDRGGAEPVRRVIDDNFASLFTLLGDDAGAHARLARAQRFAVAFLAARGPELDDRAAAGRMLDGHGDLRAEHVVLDSPLEIVDAIEFDPALRQVDAGMDLAFLVMDLHARGRADLAGGLVRAYRRAGGDPGDDALLAFFAAYRAQVRAKVALIRAAQLDPEAAAATRGEASGLLSLADRLAWSARAPLVLAIAGASASGKTTLATTLAATSGRPHLNSDVVRKRRHGIAPTARAPQALYRAAENAATYRELGRLAAATPGGVIVDATFRCRTERDAFRKGLGPNDADVVFVECRVPAGVLAARATARLARADRVSDATPALALGQLRAFEPLDEVAAGAHLMIRADQDPPRLAADVADALDRRLCGSPEARDRGFP